ncbi:MAG TPA: hypothetical protein VF736_15875 [Pyrinomonadaceae bacterium]|jgi:hypothetical protein
MKKRLLTAIAAAAALQLFAAQVPAGLTARGVAGAPAAADAWGASMAQRRGKGVKARGAGEALLPGVWGGERIRFEVTERGARVEFDCAHETVEGKITVDSRGRFTVGGLHYEEHGGPVRAEEDAGGYPVRLSGLVGGSLMKLTVTRAGTKKALGTYTLTRGAEGEIVKCR